MLVDVNAYVGHWPFLQLQYNNCAGLLERMKRFGVDVSVVSNINGIFYKNTQAANEELHHELRSRREFAGRFVPFAVINPVYAGWKDDLQTCVKNFGMKGVRLYPQYHDYQLTDPACIELLKNARDLDIPVALSLRMVDYRQRSWMDLDKEWALKDVMPAMREVPDGKYLIVNIANGMNVTDEDVALIRKGNVLMDTSGRAVGNPTGLLERFGKNKFAFGTHAPVLDYLTGLLRIESLRDTEADKVTKELLRSENAKRFLKL